MLKILMNYSIILTLSLVLLPQIAYAQKKYPFDFNVGWFGATAVPTASPIAVPGRKDKVNAIILKTVMDKLPAQRAGFKAGDKIFLVNNQSLANKRNYTDGSLTCLVSFLDHIEAAVLAKEKNIEFMYLRNGEVKTASLSSKHFTSYKHSESCPEKCKYCKKITNKALAFLKKAVKTGQLRSNVKNSQVAACQTAICGLAFLATGSTAKSGPYKAEINACVKTIISITGTASGQIQSNWTFSFALIFMAEVYKTSPNPKYKKYMKEWVRELVASQEKSGGWAHGGKNFLGYVEVNSVATLSLTGMALAQQHGVIVPKDTIDRAIAYLKLSSDGNGGITYSTASRGRPGPGRTASATLGLFALGHTPETDPFLKKTIAFYQKKSKGLARDHASPLMHLSTGALLSRRLGEEAWNDYYQHYKSLIISLQNPDGSFAPLPTGESISLGSNASNDNGKVWCTANMALILSLQKNKPLMLLGNSKKKKKKEKK